MPAKLFRSEVSSCLQFIFKWLLSKYIYLYFQMVNSNNNNYIYMCVCVSV